MDFIMEWMDVFIIFIMIGVSFFFSGSETALTAVSPARVHTLIKEGNKRAQQVERLRQHKEALIGSILLGNTLANIASGSIGTIIAIRIWDAEIGPFYATIIITIVVLIFAEVLPKTIAIHNAEKVSLLVARPITLCVEMFAPVTGLVQIIIASILRMFGVNYSQRNTLISATDVIRGTIELHHSEGGMEKEHRDMLGSILDLNDREVKEVMVHRKHVYTIDLSNDPDDILQQAIESAHTRLPLYKDDPDNIVGILHVKDVIKLMTKQKIGITREMIRRIATRPWFVPDTTILSDQLLAFRQRRKHFACVIDEYGAYQGIVTLEDIIEEIVGDIDDEHDMLHIDDIIPFGDNAYRVEGTVTIRDLNRHLDWNLPDEHASTIAGLVLHEAEMIPEAGAVFEFYDVKFIIEERVGNQITRLIIEPLVADEDE